MIDLVFHWCLSNIIFSRLISQFSAYYILIDKYSYLLIYICTLYMYLIFQSLKFDPQEKFIIISPVAKVRKLSFRSTHGSEKV